MRAKFPQTAEAPDPESTIAGDQNNAKRRADLSPRERTIAGRFVFFFYMFLFLFTSSGRLNNWDPLAQLQASTALICTGSLAVDHNPLPQTADLWIANRKGAYYEAHDIGATIFLAPSAFMGCLLDGRSRSQRESIDDPSWVARVLATLEYAVLGAVGAWCVFEFWWRFYRFKTAFALSGLFVSATTYWSYTRIAYDILGGCVGVCLLLLCSYMALTDKRDATYPWIRLGAAFAFACAFRFSLTPFLAVGLVSLLIVNRKSISLQGVFSFVVAAAAGIAPNLIYNALRTGAVIKNGATGNAPVAAALHGSALSGVFGLVLSPNWGLVWFAPIFFTLGVVPFIWREMPLALRQIFLCLLFPFAAYVVVVAKLANWTGYSGWGPRYLVPLIPILFVGCGPVIVRAWRRHVIWLLMLVALSVIVNTPSICVNFRAAKLAVSGADAIDAHAPLQQIAAWRALALGAKGHPTPVLDDAKSDAIRKHSGDFPDWWFVRLRVYSALTGGAGALVGLFLMAGTTCCLRRIIHFCNNASF